MKVWITKYALTEGIREADVDQPSAEPSMVVEEPKSNDRYRQYFHGEGREWHRTREAAEAKAEQMRQAKIASLKKQIAKLERLSFGAQP